MSPYSFLAAACLLGLTESDWANGVTGFLDWCCNHNTMLVQLFCIVNREEGPALSFPITFDSTVLSLLLFPTTSSLLSCKNRRVFVQAFNLSVHWFSPIPSSWDPELLEFHFSPIFLFVFVSVLFCSSVVCLTVLKRLEPKFQMATRHLNIHPSAGIMHGVGKCGRKELSRTREEGWAKSYCSLLQYLLELFV